MKTRGMARRNLEPRAARILTPAPRPGFSLRSVRRAGSPVVAGYDAAERQERGDVHALGQFKLALAHARQDGLCLGGALLGQRLGNPAEDEPVRVALVDEGHPPRAVT